VYAYMGAHSVPTYTLHQSHVNTKPVTASPTADATTITVNAGESPSTVGHRVLSHATVTA
jgi:hypothetical protein